jgi:cyclopropane fatty-acyl-phospholipid synthase-like methyltransferase
MNRAELYTDGTYLECTGGTWHIEDSAAKARWALKLLGRHPEATPKSIAEIGCGAGAILSAFQGHFPESSLTGYEISPQAYALCETRTNESLRFVLGDAFEDGERYDLLLVLDVIEHVEDCFAFLRAAKAKGRYKLFNIPLDTSASFAVRGYNLWDTVGHIHLFTFETAMKTLEYTEYHVLDWLFMPAALERARKRPVTQLMNAVRASLASVSPKMASRLCGGYSLMVLAE